MHNRLTLVAFLLVGCLATVVQVLFIREFMVVFFGNELCLGIIMAGWLGGITLGAASSSYLIKRCASTLSLFVFLTIAASLTPFIQIYAIRTIRTLLAIPPGEYANLITLTASTFFLILPFSILIGLLFPTACTLLGEGRGNKAQQIGWVYICEAIGSLAGGFLITIYMLPRVRPYEILAFLALLLLMNCFLISLRVQGAHRLSATLTSLILLPVLSYLLLSGSVSRLDDYGIEKRWDAYQNKLQMLVSLDSRYQNIVVAYKDEQYSLFGNGQYLHSFPDPYDSVLFTHLTLAQHPSPRTILLVGTGDAEIVKEMLKYPLAKIDCVALDGKILEATLPFISREDRSALLDKRVNIFHTDGRHYIKQAPTTYDMVILNLPDPSTAMLNRFYTREFFQEVKSLLREGGVVVTGIAASLDYLGGETGVYTSSLYHTLKAVFPHLVVIPGAYNYFIASSTAGSVTTDSDVLAARHLRHAITSDYFTPYHFSWLVPEYRVAEIRTSLEKKTPLQINTDTHPISYFYNLVLWIMVAGDRGPITFLQPLMMSVKGLVIVALFFFSLRVLYVLMTRKRLSCHLTFNGLLAIATTGFAGMALEIVLLFAFQNIYGYIYQKAGLLIALFMLGLALGGYLMNRLLGGRERNWIILLITFEVLLCIFSASLPFAIAQFSSYQGVPLPANISTEYLFMLMVVVAGLLTGIEFPLVSRIIIDRGELGNVAGWMGSCDHLGACLGALLTGTLVVPLMGFYYSCWFTGLLNLGSALLLAIYLLQARR